MQKLRHNKIKKIYLLYICIILLLIFSIIQIYAVFQSEVEGTINLANGIWQIKVNNTEISNGVNKEFTVEEIEIQNNDHVKPRKFSPRFIRNV